MCLGTLGSSMKYSNGNKKYENNLFPPIFTCFLIFFLLCLSLSYHDLTDKSDLEVAIIMITGVLRNSCYSS